MFPGAYQFAAVLASCMLGEVGPEPLRQDRTGLRLGWGYLPATLAGAGRRPTGGRMQEPGEGQDQEHAGGEARPGRRRGPGPRRSPGSPRLGVARPTDPSHHPAGHVGRRLAGQPGQEVAQARQAPELLGEPRIGEQGRLDRMLLFGAELAIQVGTQESNRRRGS